MRAVRALMHALNLLTTRANIHRLVISHSFESIAPSHLPLAGRGTLRLDTLLREVGELNRASN